MDILRRTVYNILADLEHREDILEGLQKAGDHKYDDTLREIQRAKSRLAFYKIYTYHPILSMLAPSIYSVTPVMVAATAKPTRHTILSSGIIWRSLVTMTSSWWMSTPVGTLPIRCLKKWISGPPC